jgi:hypothetical protein
MTPRAIEDATSNKRTDESFDFPETSDMCDFGYVLATPPDTGAASSQAERAALEIARKRRPGCRAAVKVRLIPQHR